MILRAEAAVAGFSVSGFQLGPIDLQVQPGEWISVVGPNGAGKSTLLKMLAGLLAPYRGHVSWDGQPLGDKTSLWRARHLAYIPPLEQSLFSLSVWDTAAQGLFSRSRWAGWGRPDTQTVDEALQRLDLWALRHRSVAELSSGERQRVGLARALAQQARVLLLDEPGAHLDVRHQGELFQTLDRLRRRHGVAVVCALHDLHWAARMSDRLWVIKSGKIILQGHPSSVCTPEALGRTFEVPPSWWRMVEGLPTLSPFFESGLHPEEVFS